MAADNGVQHFANKALILIWQAPKQTETFLDSFQQQSLRWRILLLQKIREKKTLDDALRGEINNVLKEAKERFVSAAAAAAK